MLNTDAFPRVPVASAAELRDWLLAHHTQPGSVWLVTHKKSTPEKYVSTAEVLDELIAFGWVDGIRRKLDTERTMQLISPRQVQHWAQSYKDRAAKLEAEGRMHAAGHAAIQRSKAAGLWDFMADVDQLISPPDLIAALSLKPTAEQFFNALAPSAKRFTLRWIKLAKTEATREKRIIETVAKSDAGEFVYGVRMS